MRAARRLAGVTHSIAVHRLRQTPVFRHFPGVLRAFDDIYDRRPAPSKRQVAFANDDNIGVIWRICGVMNQIA